MSGTEFINAMYKRFSPESAAKAVLSTHSLMTQRIFGEGENSKNAEIGQYNDKKALYVNPKNAPKSFTPKGKTGSAKFNNGKAHKTGYFSSYKAFRANQGRRTDRVNLNLEGDLFKDFAGSLIRVAPGQYISGLRNRANVGKYQGAIKKYGRTVFQPSAKEKQLLIKNLTSA